MSDISEIKKIATPINKVKKKGSERDNIDHDDLSFLNDLPPLKPIPKDNTSEQKQENSDDKSSPSLVKPSDILKMQREKASSNLSNNPFISRDLKNKDAVKPT